MILNVFLARNEKLAELSQHLAPYRVLKIRNLLYLATIHNMHVVPLVQRPTFLVGFLGINLVYHCTLTAVVHFEPHLCYLQPMITHDP